MGRWIIIQTNILLIPDSINCSSFIRLNFQGLNSIVYFDRITFTDGALLKTHIYFQLTKNLNNELLESNIEGYNGDSKLAVVTIRVGNELKPFLFVQRSFVYLNVFNIDDLLENGNIRQLLINFISE